MPPKMKDNPRKAELKTALGQAQGKSGSIEGILKGAQSAMEAKAWVGGSSDSFGSGLSGATTDAKKGGTDSVQEIQDEYDRTPAQVPDPSAEEPR